ncbi:epithelial discoidin domain-containing receptor 1-like, partial [Phasianus colchicus]|uniref:epithelial discoidin domain-containing receptor 1-like n=1 Tax=Phasianus colchicus TaxID=9054 RepID=UPI00129E3451
VTLGTPRVTSQVIGGNEDPQGVVLKDLSPPLVAVALRVHPRAPRAMSVCLRLELYGCPWDAGLLSYTAPRGHTMSLHPTTIVLNDSTYDGDSAGPLLYGGLGQLADGVLGLDDFTRSRERRLWPGYDYVGWRRPPGPQPHVELEFEFEQLRMFRAMKVHCNNMRTRGVSIFTAVECSFKHSLDAPWEPPDAPHHPEGTIGDPRARWVTVPLGGRRGRFVRCRFFFAGEWMLFSEVNFVSGGWRPPWEPKAGQPVAKEDHSHTSILIGCLVAIILLLLAVIVLILWRHHWRKILGKVSGGGPSVGRWGDWLGNEAVNWGDGVVG